MLLSASHMLMLKYLCKISARCNTGILLNFFTAIRRKKVADSVKLDVMYFSVYTSHENFFNSAVCFRDITFSIPVTAKHNTQC